MPEHEKKRGSLDATERLARAMERQTSFGYRFLLGVVTGIGTALGATIIASVLVYMLVQFFQSIGWQEQLQTWGLRFDAVIEEKLDAEVESRLQR